MIIEVLYPDAANLYGCLFDIEYLKKTVADLEVHYTNLDAVPYFVDNDVDLIYLGVTKERYQEKFIGHLKPYTDRLKELIQKNVIIIALGNSFEIFGQKIDDLEALGIFNYTSQRDFSKHHLSRFLGRFEDMDLIGFKSKFSDVSHIDEPFMEVKKGFGCSDDPKHEGIRHHNFYGTYLIGPIFIMNPLFYQYILKKLDYQKAIPYLDDALEAYHNRLDEFINNDSLFK